MNPMPFACILVTAVFIAPTKGVATTACEDEVEIPADLLSLQTVVHTPDPPEVPEKERTITASGIITCGDKEADPNVQVQIRGKVMREHRLEKDYPVKGNIDKGECIGYAKTKEKGTFSIHGKKSLRDLDKFDVYVFTTCTWKWKNVLHVSSVPIGTKVPARTPQGADWKLYRIRNKVKTKKSPAVHLELGFVDLINPRYAVEVKSINPTAGPSRVIERCYSTERAPEPEMNPKSTKVQPQLELKPPPTKEPTPDPETDA